MSFLQDGFCRESARRIAGVFFLAAAWAGLSGCALVIPQTEELRTAWPAQLPERVEIAEVPFFPQDDFQCGPAALATSLAHFKVPVKPEDLVSKVYLPARQGSLQVEMLAATRTFGLVSYQLPPKFEAMLRELAAGTPVIVLQDYGVWPVSIWHYAVVVGYDREKGELLLRSGVKDRLVIPFAVFEYTWREGDYWSMVTMPPGRVPVSATETSYLEAVVAMERVGPPEAARSAYASFLGRWPDNLTAAVGLANRHYAAGDLAGAEAALRNAATRHPDAVVVTNNLAQTLSDQGRDEEALALIEPVFARAGAYAAEVRDTRTSILRRLGRAPLELKGATAIGGSRSPAGEAKSSN
jgi:hypothetical protein